MNKTEFAKFILKKYSITRDEAIINMFTGSVMRWIYINVSKVE